MKKYYTLIQPFMQEGRSLSEYLTEQGISFTIGADFASEMSPMPDIISGEDPLFKVYVILVDEYALSAIKLAVNDAVVVKNRPFANLKNAIRTCFSWFSWHSTE